MAIVPEYDLDLDVEYVSVDEGIAMLDRQAQREFGISGEEFVRRYQSGQLDEFDPSAVFHVSLILPFAGYSLDGREYS